MRAPTERFSDRVADYVRYRPSYPKGVVDLIVARANISPESLIADIGCGTGIFATLLLETGASVVGIEPNEPMLQAAVSQLGSQSKFSTKHASAEQTGLADESIDAITAAQAFHWFDQPKARAEFRRILKPEGWVFLVWNERKSRGSKFSELYESALRDCSPEYALVGHRNTPDAEVLEWFENLTAEMATFSNAQAIDLEGFLGRAYSSSYVPAAGTREREAITERLTQVFYSCEVDGNIELKYETKVYLGQLSPSSA